MPLACLELRSLHFVRASRSRPQCVSLGCRHVESGSRERRSSCLSLPGALAARMRRWKLFGMQRRAFTVRRGTLEMRVVKSRPMVLQTSLRQLFTARWNPVIADRASRRLDRLSHMVYLWIRGITAIHCTKAHRALRRVGGLEGREKMCAALRNTPTSQLLTSVHLLAIGHRPC